MNPVDWPDSTVPQPTSTPTGGTDGAVVAGTSTGTGVRGGGSAKRRKSSASSHQRRSIIVPPSDDEGKRRSWVEGEEPPSEDEYEYEYEEGDSSGEYVGEEEVEDAIVDGTPSAPTTTTTPGGVHKTIPWGRKHIGHQPDEEDDELMMYAKV